MLSDSAALAERAGVQAVPRAGTWEISRDFLALDRYRQDPPWCRGALRVGQGWSGHRGAARLPALTPAPPAHPMPPEEEGCSGGGECPLSLIEKVTENVSPSGDRVRGFRELFPRSHPGALVEGGPQAQDDVQGDAW